MKKRKPIIKRLKFTQLESTPALEKFQRSANWERYKVNIRKKSTGVEKRETSLPEVINLSERAALFQKVDWPNKPGDRGKKCFAKGKSSSQWQKSDPGAFSSESSDVSIREED